MALFHFVFCFTLLYSTSHCLVLPSENQEALYPGTRVAEPGLFGLCGNVRQGATSRKLICFLCYGWDPSCFHITTSTTSTTTTTTTTKASSSPTTNPSTTSTAKSPSPNDDKPKPDGEEEGEI